MGSSFAVQSIIEQTGQQKENTHMRSTATLVSPHELEQTYPRTEKQPKMTAFVVSFFAMSGDTMSRWADG